ncbi:MAG: hypothetical protein DRI89_09155 [Bacteroidetes bacterium]|nr:MAG: hypothetical protein DRI89_09155 [Bacteroidota bacterium]
MNKFLTERNLTIINFIIVLFFLLIYSLNFYKVDFVLIGVFRELLTIPFLIAQFVFLFFGIQFLIKEDKRNFLTVISILVLAISTIITISSFF